MFSKERVKASNSLVILTPFKLYAEIVKMPMIVSMAKNQIVPTYLKNISILSKKPWP